MFVPDCDVNIIEVCTSCGRRYGYWCSRQNHTKEQRYNVPFLVPDMQIINFGKWTTLKSEKFNRKFQIARSKIKDVIMGPGIAPGGKIENQWWKFTSLGGSESLAWLGSADGEYKP